MKAGHKNLIGTTRNPERLDSLSQRGVEIRHGDFKEPAGLVNAFKSATRMLLISTVDIGGRVGQHKNAIEAAKKAGIRHILYTSWPNPEQSLAGVAADHAETEELIRESGLKYTFLRNYLYAENLLNSLPVAVQMGKLYGCAGDGKAAYVLRQDCAQAAADVLMNAQRYENSTFDVSGPRSYSYSELVEIFGEITGKKIAYVDLSPEEFKAISIKSGLPDAFADLFVSFDLAIKKGDLSEVTGSVEKLSGKPAQDIREFLKLSLRKE